VVDDLHKAVSFIRESRVKPYWITIRSKFGDFKILLNLGDLYFVQMQMVAINWKLAERCNHVRTKSESTSGVSENESRTDENDSSGSGTNGSGVD